MFLSDLVVKRIVGLNNVWQLKEPLIYRKENLKIIVPKGFIFDFASIPKLFWNIFSPNGGRYDRASCLHDWLYATQCLSRKESDWIFYLAMLDDRTPKWKAKIFYWGVRVGGSFAWNNNKKKAKELAKYWGKPEIK